MFRSSDDLNIDEDFLSDAFDIPSTTDSNKRNSDSLTDQPVKKLCTLENNTKNILSIINSKNSESCTKLIASPSTKNNRSAAINNQEKRRVVQRKFPGPAGILPEQKQIINIKALEESETSKTEPDEIVCSQLSEDIFRKDPWLQMYSDWSTIYNGISLPQKYTISWTKSKAASKKLIGQKTPFLAAVIQTVDCSSKDPMILLKDKTGDIQATLLHEVWEEYGDYLYSGSVIVLKQVGVLSTLKKHYLAVTLNNIVAIYSEQENEETGRTVEITNIQTISVEEFIQSIKITKQQFEALKLLKKLEPTSNNPYFKKPNNSPQKSSEIVANISSAQSETNNPYFKKPNNIPQKSSEISNVPAQSETNLNKTSNKFSFKAKINTQDLSKQNKENTSNISEDSLVLTQILDGVDASSLFEDF